MLVADLRQRVLEKGGAGSRGQEAVTTVPTAAGGGCDGTGASMDVTASVNPSPSALPFPL